jgi:predicted DNA-binding protein
MGRPRINRPPRKHVRLEIAAEDHEKLRALAGLHGKTIVGYVREMVRQRIRRFEKGDEDRRSRGTRVKE